MNRVIALSAATALCTLWAAGCASTGAPDKTASTPTPAAQDAAVAGLDSSADVSAIAQNLPSTLAGEIRRAQQLRSKGDLDEASKSLAQLMIVAPDDPRVIGEYGKVLAQKGNAQGAVAFLKRAIALQPKDGTLYSALGVAYDQLDDHTNARAAYERALALQPNDAAVLNNYAVSRMLAGDLAGAQHLLEMAAARGSANPKIANNMSTLAGMKPQPAKAVAAGPVAATTTNSNRTASAPPKTINRQVTTRTIPASVVMQTVPVDPQAGPVKPPELRKLASTAKPKHAVQKLASPAQPSAAAQAAPAPELRTAADAN